jgi:hypothetical protein
MTEYRKLYNKAKSELARRHNQELHTIMTELGYVRKERVLKVKDNKKAEAKKEVKAEPKKEEKKN